ncbi:hypothetical protein HGP17_06395 [Rhizobium sp. P38BS-XIX]|uniref:hypothetical protein n=1 Tax=Rhizobium sp. P38BS-XIX TaxID=2726740 RepID=UPI001457242B|nr:hypothetical protein [Rhizobium sp. P38BS-XIX]NLR96459.1 hypothetical protein [Rhizobium sp. P38BS-XIX]
MKLELGEWNNGRGIDIGSWTGCVGNFSLAVGYSSIFWPSFVAHRQYILVEGFSEEGLRAFESAPASTRRSIEWVMNHLHVADIQHSECADISSDKLILLGKRLVEIFAAKLQWQFPDREFVVEFIKPENPEELMDYQVSFFQK